MLHYMKVRTNTQVTLKVIQKVIFDYLMIADFSYKIPVSPLRQGLLETAQKSINLVRGCMEENVQQSLFVVRTAH